MKSIILSTALIIISFMHISYSQPASKIFCASYNDATCLVYSANLDGTGIDQIVMPLRPKCIAIDWSSSPHKMYVGLVPTSGNGKIIRCDVDGSNQEDVLTEQIGINDIELDLINRKIYWLQNTYSDDRIFYADMDGLNSNVTQIYATTVAARDLWGLAIDVTNQRLWITERGGTCYSSYIRRMNCSGTDVTILKNPVCNPHDIEYFNNKIFWGDADGLECANTDASGMTTLDSTARINGLAIDGTNNKIYWIDYYQNNVKRVNHDGTGIVEILSGLGSFTHLDTDYKPDILDADFTTELPLEFNLFQNYPNPFNPTTTIQFDIPNAGFVTLKVYNLLGQEVAMLVNEGKKIGRYEVEFDGSKLPSGIYFYRLVAGDYVSTRKFILIK
ncbi:MAG: T9SS type A sorting domain-containing protein [Ignavibacteriales bacterium]|nr:T9SS type A sorting domain-containing protein [Ignavibacteriales bacterium]